ncbi:hypothetical protein SNEBB_000297 [Seison nebaliae]|nr:hypothetical protein SNEBB_000297 [Seison nebaliae]
MNHWQVSYNKSNTNLENIGENVATNLNENDGPSKQTVTIGTTRRNVEEDLLGIALDAHYDDDVDERRMDKSHGTKDPFHLFTNESSNDLKSSDLSKLNDREAQQLMNNNNNNNHVYKDDSLSFNQSNNSNVLPKFNNGNLSSDGNEVCSIPSKECLLSQHPSSNIQFVDGSYQKNEKILENSRDEIAASYGDFHTIDWLRDLAKDRLRHRCISYKKKNGTISDRIKALHDAWSGWICVFFVGLSAGALAGFCDIGAQWIGDFKEGVCVGAFWLNREHCCWSSKNLTLNDYKVESCPEWKSWPSVFGDGNAGAAEYLLSYILYIIWSLLIALFAALLVRVFAPYACASGIPEIKTILSGFIIRGFLGKWTLLVKSIGMILSTSASLTLGKEGPFVHVGCCLGNLFSNFFPKYGRNEAKKREILSAASAAGIAVAFGAPIAGVLFSLEEISYYFPLKTLWRSFFCAMIAAFTLRCINPFGNGHDVLYFMELGSTTSWYFFELIPFAIIGILGGIYGSFFIHCSIRWAKYRRRSFIIKYPISEIMLLTGISALLYFPNPYTRMNMLRLIRRLVSHCTPDDLSDLCDYKRNFTVSTGLKIEAAALDTGAKRAIWQLLLALPLQAILIIPTANVKLPAGLFIPSMSIGAILGRVIGIGVEQMTVHQRNFFLFRNECGSSDRPCVMPALYALIGACAFLGGITRMTVALVVMMFEITGTPQFIVPLMITAMTAKWTGDAFSRGGIYDANIELNKYPFLDNKEEYNVTTQAKDVMHPQESSSQLITLEAQNMTIDDIEIVMETKAHSGYPVLLGDDLIGYVLRRDLRRAFVLARKNGDYLSTSPVVFHERDNETFDATYLHLNRLVDRAPITLNRETSMETVMDMFRKLGLSIVLVMEKRKLVGIITKKDVLRHLQYVTKYIPDTIISN